MKIEQTNNGAKAQRISAHSHIKGLGLDPSGKALEGSCGLIGQDAAREVTK